MTTPKEKIGTLEFCTALNGDDPAQAISFLKRFVQTVRKEKIEALSAEFHQAKVVDDSDVDDDLSVDSQQPPSKKAKVEKWKVDSKSYNVPFVGTSTYKGSTGIVRIGEWPSGFLEAYLEQSPKAIEILGSGTGSGELPLVPPHGSLHEALLSRKESSGKQLSAKLYGLYIEALGEIASCGIPSDIAKNQMKSMTKIDIDSEDDENKNSAKLEKNVQVKVSYQQIISTIMKEHLLVLYNVLNNECTNSHKQSYILIEGALTTLANLASTSVGSAREIIKGLDSNLKEGVLQRLAPTRFKGKKDKEGDSSDSKEVNRKNSELKAKAAYLHLASVLLESDDLITISFAISPGVKETKSKPGIAFIALRRVSATYSFHQFIQISKRTGRKAYYVALRRFFCSIRLMLSSKGEHQEKSGPSRQVSLVTMVTFLQGDVLENITRTACMSFGEDENKDSLECIKRESRLIIMTVIYDKDQSPFLKQLQSDRFSDNILASCTNNLTRCIQILLSCSADMVETRTFVLRCFNNTPKLFTAFLGIVTVPEPMPSFSCISSFDLITFLIEKGPHVWNFIDGGKINLTAEKAVFNIIPRGLTKNILTKALQNSNPLLLLGCLKVIRAVMNRLDCFINDVSAMVGGQSLVKKCVNILIKRLPDLQVLLSVRSKFDPFRLNENSKQVANSVVTMNFCEVLRRYASVFTTVISSLQFDWIKFLPENATVFCSAEMGLQNRLLTTLASIYDCYQSMKSQSNTMATPKAFQAFCSIMIESKHPSIYNLARNLAIKTLENVIRYRSSSGSDGVCHELMLWVDGITSETLPTFCKMLIATQKITVQHDVIISNAWQEYHPKETMEEATFTPILTVALASIATETQLFSETFVTLICRVIAATLTYQFNPMPLASVIKFNFKSSSIQNNSKLVDMQINSLVRYATSIVEREKNLIQKAHGLLGTLFGDDNIHSRLADYLMDQADDSSLLDKIYLDVINGADTSTTVSLIIRQCIHHTRLDVRNDVIRNKVDRICLRLCPVIVQRYDDTAIIKAISEKNLSISRFATIFSIVSSTAAERPSDQSHSSSLVSSTCIDMVCLLILRFFMEMGDQIPQLEQILTQLAFASGMLPLIPSNRLGPLLRPIVDCCALMVSSNSYPITHVVPFLDLLPKILRAQSSQLLQDLPVGSIFSLWKALSGKDSKDPIIISTKILLEHIMAELLNNYENYGLNGALLMSNLLNTTAGVTTEIAFINSTKDHKFLLSLLLFDASIFSKPIVNRLQDENDNSGYWDPVIYTIVEQVNSQKSCQGIVPSYAIDATVKRLETITIDSEDTFFHSFIIAMGSLMSNGRMNSTMFGKILNRSPVFFRTLRKLRHNGIPTTAEMEFLDFMRNAALLEELREKTLPIIAMSLTHISSSLAKVLKSADTNQEACNKYLMITVDMLHLLDAKTITSIQSSVVKRMVVTCLKFGIQCNAAVSSHCLVVIRLLLTILYSESHLDEKYKDDLFLPHQIYAMAVSHSNFPNLAMTSNSATRRELIALMICCVTLDGDNIMPMSWDILSALLTGFNASLNKDDRLLQRLIYLYESCANKAQASFCQSNILWGQAQSNVKSSLHVQNTLGSDHGEQWEPLLLNLEIRRIRQTIADFPAWETAKPPREEEIEVRNGFDEDQDSGDKHVLKDDNESLDKNSAASSEYSPRRREGIAPETYKLRRKQQGENDMDDERYSPAFIMPLILGLLESFSLRASIKQEENLDEAPMDVSPTDENQEADNNGYEKEDPFQEYRDSYVKVVYRLSQKGAFSLSLACLSSKCPDIRKIAVSTLYFFLEALKMEESQKIAQWRERPQLEMILNSVQRGLSVVRAKKVLQIQGDNSPKNKSPIFVPMLPAVSAIFLARAALILTKPADDMYPSMNRYFLRIKANHGAYNDCFSLPAFMTLFCSANDDNNQARRERLWALQLLKDGIIDEYCYNVVARRHVPELLLTSFDGFCCRSHSSESKGRVTNTFDTECSMILEVIQTCLDFGGMSSFHHLVKGIGLFPWIQSMIHSHSNTMSVNAKFFEMLQSALRSTQQYQTATANANEFIFFDAVKLARCVICAYEKKDPSIDNDSNTPPSKLLTTICEVLSLIQNIYKNGDDNETDFKNISFQVNRNGIPISNALELMKRVKVDPVLFSKAVGAFSYLPISLEAEENIDPTIFVDFCRMVASNIISRDHSGAIFQDVYDKHSCIMKRIKLLASTIKDNFANKVEIAEIVISCRRKMTHLGLHNIWLETLLSLIPQENEELDCNEETKHKAESIRFIIKSEKEKAHRGRLEFQRMELD